eukprot:2369331-Rhodomonas_salina.2
MALLGIGSTSSVRDRQRLGLATWERQGSRLQRASDEQLRLSSPDARDSDRKAVHAGWRCSVRPEPERTEGRRKERAAA